MVRTIVPAVVFFAKNIIGFGSILDDSIRFRFDVYYVQGVVVFCKLLCGNMLLHGESLLFVGWYFSTETWKSTRSCGTAVGSHRFSR